MVVSQIEAGAEVILRAYFAEGIFHGYVADLGLAVQALLHGAVQAADFVVVFCGDQDAGPGGVGPDQLGVQGLDGDGVDDSGVDPLFRQLFGGPAGPREPGCRRLR